MKSLQMSKIDVGFCKQVDYQGKSFRGFQEGTCGLDKGVSVQFHLINNSNKTIKYATFYLLPFNAVGDKISCRNTGKTVALCDFTGPLDPGSKRPVIFEDVWYNNHISKVLVAKVSITYMDGTSIEIRHSDIDFSLASPEDEWKPLESLNALCCIIGIISLFILWGLYLMDLF